MATDTHVLCLAQARRTSALRALEKGKRTVRNQIAYEGEWAGHPAGEFEFTRALFEQIIANFERRTDPVPLTYGHPDGETASWMGAAGWIHGLAIDTDEKGRTALFAEMEFTERAASQVRNGEQRHCSVVVGFESIDEKTGEPIGAELFEVGLVLSAFLDDMRPLAAGRHRTPRAHGAANTQEIRAMSMKDILKEALKELPDDATREQVLAYMDAAAKKAEAIEGTPEPEPAPEAAAEDQPDEMAAGKPEGETVAAGDEPSADVVAAADAPAEEVAAGDADMPVEMMDGEGSTAESAVQTVVDEIVAAGGDADPVAVAAFLQDCAGELAQKFLGMGDGTEADAEAAAMGKRAALEAKGLQRKVTALSKRVAELESEKKAAIDKALGEKVDAAIEAGAFEKAEREELVELGRKAPKQLDTLIAKMSDAAPPKGLPLGRVAAPAPAAGDDVSDDAGPQTDDEKAYVASLKKRGVKNVDVRLGLYREQKQKLSGNEAHERV